jgi:hypothetical protein
MIFELTVPSFSLSRNLYPVHVVYRQSYCTPDNLPTTTPIIDTISRGSRASQLTCGNVGKGSRLAAHTQSKAYLAKHDRFQVLPGFSDIMWPGMNVGMTGSITGTGTCLLR